MFMKRRSETLIFLRLVVIVFSAHILFHTNFTVAAINQQIPFYGALNDSAGNPLTGTYDMVFRFYDSASGGTLMDTSTHTAGNGNAVTVTNGEFAVMLGSGTGNALDGVNFNTAAIYVGLTVESDTEMTPRERLGAAPYAFNSETLDGFDSLDFLRGNATGSLSASSADTLFSITQSGAGDILNIFDSSTEVFTILDGGNVGIGTSAPDAILSVSHSGSSDILRIDDQLNDISPFLIDSAGNVGVGTSSPTALLDVWGSFRVGVNTSPLLLVDTASDRIAIGTNSFKNIVNLTGNTSGGMLNIQNTSNTGYSSIDFDDNNGIRRMAFGYANTGAGINYAGTNYFESHNTVPIQFRISDQNVLRIDTTDNVLIGTTTAVNARLSIQAKSTEDILKLFRTTGQEVFTVDSSGNVGIGTTSPTATLSVKGTLRFEDLGSSMASLITDSQGNVSVSSDERLKTNFSNFDRGLESIMNLQPINYKWSELSGMETHDTYTGFSAQNVLSNIPEAVSVGKNGYLTLADRPILAAAINAINEQQKAFDQLLSTGKTLSTSKTFASLQDGKENTIWEKIVNLVSGFKNDILSIVGINTTIVYTKSLEANRIQVDELCLRGECINSFREFDDSSLMMDTADTLDKTNQQVGVAQVKSQKSSTTIIFDKPFVETPIVVLTPTSNVSGGWFLSEASPTGFVIELATEQQSTVEFNWQATGYHKSSKTSAGMIDDNYNKLNQTFNDEETNSESVTILIATTSSSSQISSDGNSPIQIETSTIELPKLSEDNEFHVTDTVTKSTSTPKNFTEKPSDSLEKATGTKPTSETTVEKNLLENSHTNSIEKEAIIDIQPVQDPKLIPAEDEVAI
jgi:hypothetical protein